MDIVSITGLASGLLGLAQKALGIVKDSTDNELKIELQGAIMELQQKVFDIQTAASKLLEEKSALKEKIKQLEDNSEKEKRMEWTDGKTCAVYTYEDGRSAHICLKCWNVHKQIIHMMKDGKRYICINCGNQVY